MGRHQKDYYHELNGCTASIRQCRDGLWLLRICDPLGNPFITKKYTTHRGARIALGILSEGMMERRI